MRDSKLFLAASMLAGAIFALAAPALAAGIGGVSIGGMGIAMPSGGVSGALGAVGAGLSAPALAGGASQLSAGHLPIGALDGPNGLSATSGRSPFGHAKASSAWASLPQFDPNLPGMAVPIPSTPSLSAPAVPGTSPKSAISSSNLDVHAKVDASIAGQSAHKSLDVNTSSLKAPALPSSETPSAKTLTKAANGPEETLASATDGKGPQTPSSADLNKTLKSDELAASVLSSLAVQEQQAYVNDHVMPALADAQSSKSANAKAKSIEQDLGHPPTVSQEQKNVDGTTKFATGAAQMLLP